MAFLLPDRVRSAITPRRDNPDFPLSFAQAAADARRMHAEPARLARPLVLLAGYRAPWIEPRTIAKVLARLVHAQEGEILPIAYPRAASFPPVVERVLELVERRWPGGTERDTVEVDAIGFSMGGLVARLAELGEHLDAGSPRPKRRLRIARLFTVASPHRGARLARVARPDALATAMAPGSAFLRRLEALRPRHRFDLVCYATLNDAWVGARRSAPEGVLPIWVDGPPLVSHLVVNQDRRVLIDIARRLRGEEPFARRGSMPPSE